jgi:hypothetical protein
MKKTLGVFQIFIKQQPNPDAPESRDAFYPSRTETWLAGHLESAYTPVSREFHFNGW